MLKKTLPKKTIYKNSATETKAVKLNKSKKKKK
jgi:hypothetical protein